MPKVEIIARRRVFDGFFKIDEAELRFERHDGRMSPVVRRLNFERGDSAAAIVVNVGCGSVYLTEQFRYAALDKAGGWLTEIVAGAIDDGETAAQAIRREIEEEIGFRTDTIEAIAEFFVSPGGTSERIFVFCATVSDESRVSAGGGVAGEDEDIKVLEWPVAEFLAKLAAGELKDAKTIVAGMWLKENAARILAR
jgi:ADP-ribose pyrophosphatase